VEAAELRSLFRQALDLGPEERSAFLRSPSLSDEMREELKALLAADLGSETFFEETIAREQPRSPGVGERFGPFETRELLGRGGMGAVFKAERVDGELAQIVAIKVVERGWLAPRALERFRQERQFLAGLVHPNIARLIDGGTRDDGVPYLVMEYVEGASLDQYCEQRQLPVPDRLRLFLPLCDAVEYAHQKLIIHRDLKPSNVLISAAGEPKLLDFGVAKALDPADGAKTQTLVLTPDFASPEQARGEEITTATDVYGLGAVLYFLLTGRAPHAVKDMSAAELQKTISETAPELPSQIRPELKGDLENIILKALHVEPHRRYRSAHQLAEDVERYLSSRPVLATPDRWSYRLNRFVKRHAIASVAALLAFAAIAGGTGMSLYEARRAEKRFAQVRDLANRFVFDFEAAIRETPGTLTARKMAIATGREYLSRLSEDAGSDANLKRELAQSYYRLSGAERSAGESGPSIEHIQKSIALLKDLKDDCCGSAEQRAQYVRAWADLAIIQGDTRSTQDGVQSSIEATRAARAFVGDFPKDPRASRSLVIALATEGSMLNNLGRAQEARPLLEEADRRIADLVQAAPQDEELLFVQVRVASYFAKVLDSLGDALGSIQSNQKAEAILDRLIEKHPQSARWPQLKLAALAGMAGSYQRLSHDDASVQPKFEATAREAYELARANAVGSPDDNTRLDALAVEINRLASALGMALKTKEQLSLLEDGKKIISRLLQKDPSNRRFLGLQESNELHVASALSDLRRWPEALAGLKQADREAQSILARWPDDVFTYDDRISVAALETKAETGLGKLDAAREACARGLRLASDQKARDKDATYPLTLIKDLREQAHALGVRDVSQ
jgi:eukaryotic-like serine/threonine-protein kinase